MRLKWKAWRDHKKNIKKEPKQNSRENRKKSRKAEFLFLLLLLAAGLLFWKAAEKRERTAAAAAKGQTTSQVTKGTLISTLSSSGTISPKDTYSITSLVEGEVLSAEFEEGDQVEKGQILYQIDVSSMESELKSANTSLERANKDYAQALEDYSEAASDYSGNTFKSTRSGFIKSLDIEVGDKVSSNTQIAAIYNDQTMKIKVPFLSGEAVLIPVGSQGTVTLSDTEEQLSAVVTAVSNMDEVLEGGRMVRYVTLETANPGGLTVSHSASAEINGFFSSGEGNFEPMTDTVMKAEVTGNGSLEVAALLVHEGDYVAQGTPIFQIAASDVEDILQDLQSKADSAMEGVESAQSKLDSTTEDYENYTITAPISGQVITKNVKIGDTISRNSNSETTLAVIYDLSTLTFEMSVDELDVGNVEVGQTVEITADALENQTFTGKVTNISLESSQSNGVTNYPVTVTLDTTDGLLPGMNVDGVITLEQAEDTLMIPVESLMRGNRVYVKDDSVKESVGDVPAGFKAVEVETGITNEDFVQILSGLEEGQEVYVDESSSETSLMMPGMEGMPGGGMPGGGMPGGGMSGGGPSGGPGGGGRR